MILSMNQTVDVVSPVHETFKALNIQQTFFFSSLNRNKADLSHSVIAVKGGGNGKAFM